MIRVILRDFAFMLRFLCWKFGAHDVCQRPPIKHFFLDMNFLNFSSVMFSFVYYKNVSFEMSVVSFRFYVSKNNLDC